MPFSAELLQTASKQVDVDSVQGDFEVAKALIEKAVAKVAVDFPYVMPKHVEIYLHGSYANKTNIYFPSNLEICVELKKTATFDPFKAHSYTVHNNYFVERKFDFGPMDFRERLFEALGELVDHKLSQSDKCIILPAFSKLRHVVEITPCFTFNYTEGVREDGGGGGVFKGVLLYDRGVGQHIVTFPGLHQQNGNTKDIATGGGYKKVVRVFKTLNAIHARENDVAGERGYFIECLLFNVPDVIYRGSGVTDIIHKTLNWLTHCNLDGFVCQNLVWQLFGHAREFWRTHDARRFINTMRQMYELFPATRTLLA